MQTRNIRSREYGPPAGVAIWLVLSLFGGVLLAPHLYNAMVWLGRVLPPLAGLRDAEFSRVATRCVMLFAVAGLYPVLRWSGMWGRAALGLPRERGWWRLWGAGWLAGTAAMILLLGAGVLTGAYEPQALTFGTLAGASLIWLVSAAFIGVLEEWLCRGVVFGSLRRCWGFVLAATVSSVFYAVLHFLKPVVLVEPVHVQWNSGLLLLPHAFQVRGGYDAYMPMLLTLVLIGAIFARLYELQGSLYFVMGLHGGWVWLIQMGREVLERNAQTLPGWYGKSDLISSAWITTAAALVLLAYLLVAPRSPREAGASP